MCAIVSTSIPIALRRSGERHVHTGRRSDASLRVIGAVVRYLVVVRGAWCYSAFVHAFVNRGTSAKCVSRRCAARCGILEILEMAMEFLSSVHVSHF